MLFLCFSKAPISLIRSGALTRALGSKLPLYSAYTASQPPSTSSSRSRRRPASRPRSPCTGAADSFCWLGDGRSLGFDSCCRRHSPTEAALGPALSSEQMRLRIKPCTAPLAVPQARRRVLAGVAVIDHLLSCSQPVVLHATACLRDRHRVATIPAQDTRSTPMDLPQHGQIRSLGMRLAMPGLNLRSASIQMQLGTTDRTKRLSSSCVAHRHNRSAAGRLLIGRSAAAARGPCHRPARGAAARAAPRARPPHTLARRAMIAAAVRLCDVK